jgi:hypothetical protein
MLDGIGDLAAAAGLLRKPAAGRDVGAGAEQTPQYGAFTGVSGIDGSGCQLLS